MTFRPCNERGRGWTDSHTTPAEFDASYSQRTCRIVDKVQALFCIR